MANIIVTGGAGFIGLNLVELLINIGHRVRVIDKLTYASNRQALDSIAPKFVQLDVCDINETGKVYKIFREFKPEIVFHLAAESHVDNSIKGSSIFVNTNVNGTHSMLEASLNYYQGLSEAEQKRFRFVHVSTDEVYGDLPLGEGYFTENTQYNPSSPYSASKAASDHLAHAWFRTHGLPVIVTHCSNNYGPLQHSEKFIPTIIRKIRDNEKIPIYGDGKNERDWIHVTDHVYGLVCAVNSGLPGNVYNFGGGENSVFQNIKMVETICWIFKNNKLVTHDPYELISFVDDRLGHDRRYAIDISETTKKLGWKPDTHPYGGIRSTVYWYLKHLK